MKKQSLLVLLLVLSFLFPGPSSAQNDNSLPGLTEDQIKAIIDTASGVRALNHIRHLTLYHRWFVSEGYNKAALYVKNQAEALGLKDVRIERLPADGKIYYATDKSLPNWEVRSAELRLVSPINKHLVSWAENPITLASYSRSADITAELVDVGDGTHESDYVDKDVLGKLVLASSPQGGGRIDLVHKLAVLERGAAGVISYRSYYLDDFPDLVTWDHLWTHELDGKDSTFGFCISKRMGWELKRLLDRDEKVVLSAKVDADITPGNYEIVTGQIPGTDLANQEVWFIAHLDHCQPSANDNASGSAAILETARTLISLTSRGDIKPRRTIRFFWVPEISGSFAYVAQNLEKTRRAVMVLNMDMVGENQNICGSVFNITRTPDSTPSFLNDLLETALEIVLAHPVLVGRELTDPWSTTCFFGTREEWRARVTPYSGGSDHTVFMGGVINVPASMFGSWPDYFYHSSGDTPDKSDSTQLKRAVLYGSMVAASVAQLDGEGGRMMLDEIFASGLERLDQAFDKAKDDLKKTELTGDDLKEALNIIHWSVRREKMALESAGDLLPDDSTVAEELNKLKAALETSGARLKKLLTDSYLSLCKQKGTKAGIARLTEEEKAAMRRVPLRNPAFPGPLSSDYIREKCRAQNLNFDFPFTSLQKFEIDAFMDGKLNALDIRNAVSAECGPVNLTDVLAYLMILEKLNLVHSKK